MLRMRKGLGMWIMSKLVLVIFLFALMIVLTGFLRVYEEKVIADTARDNTALLAEVGNTALSFQSAGGTFFLEPFVVVEDQYQQYTIVVQAVGERGSNDRVLFLFAWKNQDSLDTIHNSGGFVSASSLDMPPEIRADGSTPGKIWLFDGNAKGTFELLNPVKDSLLVQPSLSVGQNDEYMLFYRNSRVFCIGSKMKDVPVEDAMTLLAKCCKPTESEMEDAGCGA